MTLRHRVLVRCTQNCYVTRRHATTVPFSLGFPRVFLWIFLPLSRRPLLPEFNKKKKRGNYLIVLHRQRTGLKATDDDFPQHYSTSCLDVLCFTPCFVPPTFLEPFSYVCQKENVPQTAKCGAYFCVLCLCALFLFVASLRSLLSPPSSSSLCCS